MCAPTCSFDQFNLLSFDGSTQHYILYSTLPTGARELDNLLKAFPDDQPVKAKSAQAKFARRDPTAERAFVYDFFKTGLDAEDLKYTRICYEKMLNEEDTVRPFLMFLWGFIFWGVVLVV